MQLLHDPLSPRQMTRKRKKTQIAAGDACPNPSLDFTDGEMRGILKVSSRVWVLVDMSEKNMIIVTTTTSLAPLKLLHTSSTTISHS